MQYHFLPKLKNDRTRLSALIGFALLVVAIFSAIPPEAAHAQTQSNVSVQTYTGSSPIFGYYVTLWQNGVAMSSCFSTCTFTVNNDQVYQLSVSNYGNECFLEWQGGSTNAFYTVEVTSTSMTSITVSATYGPCNTGSGTSQLTIATQDTSGNILTGFYAVVNQSSTVVGTGFTPASFTLNEGQSYSVQVDNYGNCHFDHWLDTGSSAFSRTVSISSNTQYTAVMNCGSAGGAGTSQLTVGTQDMNGNPISGYYTVLNESSTIVATGFTPVSFALNDGQSYIIQVDHFGSCRFDHWLDTGSTTFSRTTSISSNTQYIAVMNCGSGVGTGSTLSLSVSAVNIATSQPINGMYVILFGQSGTVVATGFTNVTFQVVSGQVYMLQADNYGSCQFEYWQFPPGTSGVSTSTSNPITFAAANSNETPEVVYSCG
jgi:hypothetical protein